MDMLRTLARPTDNFDRLDELTSTGVDQNSPAVLHGVD
jgi:hypothetical protein